MRTKFEKPRIPSDAESTFIKMMEKYGHLNGGIKVTNLSILVFGCNLTPSLERELRRYRERYQNFKYINVIPQGKIIKRGAFYKLILNDTPPFTVSIPRK